MHKLIFSSTNAYMLMYRRKDTDYNVTFDAPSQWPEHMIELREKLIREEDDEIDRKSKDRDLCKVGIINCNSRCVTTTLIYS